MILTSTADYSGHKQSQVAVVQLQCIKLCGKLELWLHHITERSPQALEEFPGDEARAICYKKPVLIHAGGEHCKEGLVHSIFQKSHLIVEVQT